MAQGSHAGAHDRRSYEQFCPLARAMDVLGERWTLLLVRELLVAPMRFSDLRAHLDGIGSALLTQRLRDLERAGLVERAELPPPAARTVYQLTERGRALEPVIYELARFGLPYLDVPTEEQPLHPHLLPHGLKTLVIAEALPRRALVLHLAFDEGDFTMHVAPPTRTADRAGRRRAGRSRAGRRHNPRIRRRRGVGAPRRAVVRGSARARTARDRRRRARRGRGARLRLFLTRDISR